MSLERLFAEFLSQLVEFNIPTDLRPALEPHLKDTARRVCRMYENDLLSGYRMSPEDILKTDFKDGYDSIVIVRKIPFYSLCAHHMLPFFGMADVAYLPYGRVVGLSKLARIVECFARRLQIQEQMGEQVVQALVDNLQVKGAACILRAEHLCMGCRGVNKPGTETVTSSLRGVFRDLPEARAEHMSLLGRN